MLFDLENEVAELLFLEVDKNCLKVMISPLAALGIVGDTSVDLSGVFLYLLEVFVEGAGIVVSPLLLDGLFVKTEQRTVSKITIQGLIYFCTFACAFHVLQFRGVNQDGLYVLFLLEVGIQGGGCSGFGDHPAPLLVLLLLGRDGKFIKTEVLLLMFNLVNVMIEDHLLVDHLPNYVQQFTSLVFEVFICLG